MGESLTIKSRLWWNGMLLYSLALAISLIFSALEIKGVSERVSRLMFYVSSGLLFILVGLNRMNPDYNGYSGSFYNGNDNLEIGYRFFNWLLKSAGLPFESVILIAGLLLMLVFYKLASGQHRNQLVLYYLMFPLALDLPQLRNTFMYLLVILFLVIFAHRNRLIFLGGIVLSTTFHMLGILYAPFVLLIKKDRKAFYRWITILFTVLTLGAIGLRIALKIFPFPNDITEEIDPFEWFYFAIQVVQIGIDLFTFWWIDRKLKANADISAELTNRSLTTENLYRFGIYSLLYLPLVSLSTEMYRFRRNAQLIKYAYSAYAMNYLSLKDRLILTGLLLVNVAFVVGMLIYTGDAHIFTYFDQNWLLQILGVR